MQKVTITRQDGKKITLNVDGNIDYEITHYGEAYVLSVTDATTDNVHIVGIFYDKATACEAVEYLEKSGIVISDIGGKILSAYEYLEIEDKLEFDREKHAKELKGLTALQYLNEQICEQ